MIELIFLLALFGVLYHLYRIFNEEFDIRQAIIIFIFELIMLGLFIALTSVTQNVEYAVYLKFVSLFVTVEFILFIIEILFYLGYITKKTLKKVKV